MKKSKRSSTWVLAGARRDRQSITKNWLPATQNLINGVMLHETKPVLTGYGLLIELFRSEWPLQNNRVDQVFIAQLRPEAISAWHAHATTTDRLAVAAGTVRVVLYDARPNSITHGLINEFRLSDHRPGTLVVPPQIWHGVQNIGVQTAVLVNTVDTAYQYENPDHWRLSLDSSEIPFFFK